MVVGIVLLTLVLFVLVDFGLRVLLRRMDRARVARERREALDIGLRLEVSDEAPSLKRVEVPSPKARILAVDDESIILDSFRKILVLAGYAVDTVETGQEALGLVQSNPYDFVFTDLKMPDYDGLEVTKAVRHLRPDVDVIMITGYASVESAVEAMKYGAVDYVEKPFTEDELVTFVDRSLTRRLERIERQQPPKLHLVTPTSPEAASGKVFNVPAGVFVSPDHVWIRIEMTGEVQAGVDDFARKTIGPIDRVTAPGTGQAVRAGETLFSLEHGGHILEFPSPVSGKVSRVNEGLLDDAHLLDANPYEAGWVCRIAAEDLPKDLESRRIGAGAVAWYQEEIGRLDRLVREITEPGRGDAPPGDEVWEEFSSRLQHA